MRIAIGALLFEGNSFSARVSTLEDFERSYLFTGGEVLSKSRKAEVEVSGALSVLDRTEMELVPLIASHGGSGGLITDATFETLVGQLLAPLVAGETVDGVFIALHGAMACETIERPEVEILKRLRKVVGDVPVVISLDLHADVTQELVDLCTAIVCYQTYPHDDAFETGARAAGLLLKALNGTRLKMAYRKLAMLITPTTGGTRTSPAMRELYKTCRSLEQMPGIVSASYFMLTAWLEKHDGGSGFILVGDDESVDLETEIDRLAARMWALRQHFIPEVVSLTQVVADTAKLPLRPIIMSDMSDAVGAGACGDAAGTLREFLDTGSPDTLLVQLADPEAVAHARKAGVGASALFSLGNKIDTRNGTPVELAAKVLRFHSGEFTYSGGIMGGICASYGDAVVLQHGKVTVLVTSKTAYEYGYEQYSAAGLNPLDYKFVLVKNPMNFRQAFAWAPRLYALDRPGAACADLTVYQWDKCARPFFPLDDSETPIFRD